MYILILLFTLSPITIQSANYSSINLPVEHLDYYFANSPGLSKLCADDPDCPYRSSLNKDRCWGYEYRCDKNKRYSRPRCPGDHKGWVKTKEDQERTFYTQADFGYVKERRDEMKVVCEPMFPDDGSLECADNLRFCRGRNIMINFTDLIRRDEPLRYKMDVLKDGEIGGYCNFYPDRLKSNLEHLSPLQSWAPELRFFKPLSERPKCDVVIEKPTYIMKIDATVNMYHHFCDFINLYASQHLNALNDDTFSTDVHILIWETFTYSSAFQDTFKAFTQHQIWDLKTFRGETVCFKNLIFPLLPRMIFGLYYNTPIIYGCESSGLFHAFSSHVLHRLKVPLHDRINDKVRVTVLSRETKYRRILNEQELLTALADDDDYDVQSVTFTRSMTFMKQLEIVRNTDVLIGMHGAGLTHLMFLPDWGAVFELYNCEDPNCYLDLTRLRGLKYITWEDAEKLVQEDEGNHPEGGAHAKFTNYLFDVDEFLRLVRKAKDHVLSHEKFNAFIDDCLGAEEDTGGKCFNKDYPNYGNVVGEEKKSDEKMFEENINENKGHKEEERDKIKSSTVSQCTKDKGDSTKCVRINGNDNKKLSDDNIDLNVVNSHDRCQNNICQGINEEKTNCQNEGYQGTNGEETNCQNDGSQEINAEETNCLNERCQGVNAEETNIQNDKNKGINREETNCQNDRCRGMNAKEMNNQNDDSETSHCQNDLHESSDHRRSAEPETKYSKKANGQSSEFSNGNLDLLNDDSGSKNIDLTLSNADLDILNDDLVETSDCQSDNSGTVEPLDYIDIDEIDLDLIGEDEITISIDIKNTNNDDENTRRGSRSEEL